MNKNKVGGYGLILIASFFSHALLIMQPSEHFLVNALSASIPVIMGTVAGFVLDQEILKEVECLNER